MSFGYQLWAESGIFAVHYFFYVLVTNRLHWRDDMKLILLGAPGAGKGTVAKMLTAIDGSVQISTGDILRGAVQAGTDLGREAEAYMKKGDLVPDALIMGIMEKRLQEPDCRQGFLLDGFPRTIPQAKALKELLARLNIKLDMAVNIEVPKDVILDRLCTRRTCSNPECQAIYNVKSNPPKVEGICDKCGSPVVQREDETEEAISHRLATYNEKTAPLIGFYQQEGLLKTVAGTSSDAVVAAIKAELE
jgi:adenylate kinase